MTDPTCPRCGHTEQYAIEVRGVYDGTLVWQCRDCSHMWPRFPGGTLNLAALRWIAAVQGVPHD